MSRIGQVMIADCPVGLALANCLALHIIYNSTWSPNTETYPLITTNHKSAYILYQFSKFKPASKSKLLPLIVQKGILFNIQVV